MFKSKLLTIVGLCFVVQISCQDSDQTASFQKFIASQGAKHDLLIRGGSVIDGTGRQTFQADVIINRDTIAFIGETDTSLIKVDEIINASGLTVCPGFIDPHAHGNPLEDAAFENFLSMGVTTVLLGQDGSSAIHEAKFGSPDRYFEVLQQQDRGINVAFLAGHGSLRLATGIGSKTKLQPEELEMMQEKLAECLEAGCFGMSTGLEYVPGLHATTEELEALAETVGSFDGLIMSHMRSEDDDQIVSSINELADQGEHCRAHISHLKVVYGKGQARGRQIVDLLKEYEDKGVKITADVYPYLAGYTGISIVFPTWAKTPSAFDLAKKTRNAELRTYLHEKIMQRNGPEATLFGSGPFTGMTLAEVEQKSGKSFVDILMQLGPFGASGAYFVMDQELQNVFITHPEIMICTDGSPTMRHPRGYGTYARMIEQFVVRDSSISLPQLIRKITSLPAEVIGLEKRGSIIVGNYADVLVFDPLQIQENATFIDPFQYATGFNIVILNGKLVRNSGITIRKDKGRLLLRN